MSKEPERKTLLVTTVDIGDGRSDKVHLREGDSPLVSNHVCHIYWGLICRCWLASVLSARFSTKVPASS